MSLNTCETITVELSTMTFADLMSFVGADEYAYAAQSQAGVTSQEQKLQKCFLSYVKTKWW